VVVVNCVILGVGGVSVLVGLLLDGVNGVS